MKWKNLNGGYVGLVERLNNLPPHEILGVPENASVGDIKKAYRKKISISHPDRSSPFMRETDEEVTKLLNLAYKNLMRGRE